MRPGMIAARDERRLDLGNPAKCATRLLYAMDLGRIFLRADDDKIVVHHQSTVDECPLSYIFLLSLRCVNQDHVGFTPTTKRQRLTRSDRDGLHDVAGLSLK